MVLARLSLSLTQGVPTRLSYLLLRSYLHQSIPKWSATNPSPHQSVSQHIWPKLPCQTDQSCNTGVATALASHLRCPASSQQRKIVNFLQPSMLIRAGPVPNSLVARMLRSQEAWQTISKRQGGIPESPSLLRALFLFLRLLLRLHLNHPRRGGWPDQ